MASNGSPPISPPSPDLALGDAPDGTSDFYQTAADILQAGKAVPNNAAEESFSFLADLMQSGTTARKTAVHHSINGSFAMRMGTWKLILAPGSGGWSAPKGGAAWQKIPDAIQLYDLASDPAEQHDVHQANPERVAALVAQLHKEIRNGRSTPGDSVANEGDIPFLAAIVSRFPQLANQKPE